MKTSSGRTGGPRAGRLAGPVDVALARASDTVPQRLNGSDVLYFLK